MNINKNLLLAAGVLLSFGAQAQSIDSMYEFKEGVQYSDNGMQAAESDIVTKYYSYLCGACYKMEPLFSELKNRLGADISYSPVIVPGIGGQAGELLARANLFAKAKGVQAEFTKHVFPAIQEKRQRFRKPKDLDPIFAELGVKDVKFSDEAYAMHVSSLYNRSKMQIDKYDIKSTPTVVVNNKYVVSGQGIQSPEEYYALIQYLLDK